MKTDLRDYSLATGSSLPTLAGGGPAQDPVAYLAMLRGAAAEQVTKVGGKLVDGVHTTHYQAQIQPDKVVHAVPRALRADVRRTISSFGKLGGNALRVNVWIDRRHLVRRLTITGNGSISGVSATVTLWMNFPEYGPQPAPQLPPASQVGGLGT